MKDKLLAWISAHPGKSTLAGLVLAFLALFLYPGVRNALYYPRLHEGQEVVLLKRSEVFADYVLLVTKDPREVVAVGDWEGGTVIADEGPIWERSRRVDVRLRGPEVVGRGWRGGKECPVILGPDRLDVEVERYWVLPLEEAVARRPREGDEVVPIAKDHTAKRKKEADESSRLAKGEPVVLLENDDATSRGRGITIFDGERIITVPDGTKGTVIADEEGEKHNYHPARSIKVRITAPKVEGFVLRHELARPAEAIARRPRE